MLHMDPRMSNAFVASLMLTRTTAGYIRRVPGRTSQPPRYTREQSASGPHVLRTLRAADPDARPQVLHIVPVVHADPGASDDVEEALCAAEPRPNVLVLELCARRAHMLEAAVDGSNFENDDRGLKTSAVAEDPADQFQKVLASWVEQQTADIETAVNGSSVTARGAEMRRAVEVCLDKLNISKSSVILGDRRIDRTLADWAQDAMWTEKIALAFDMAVSPIVRRFGRPVAERLNDTAELTSWRKNLQRRAPAAFHALCESRENQMVWSLRDSPLALSADVVALVCGSAHAEAICTLLEKGAAIEPMM